MGKNKLKKELVKLYEKNESLLKEMQEIKEKEFERKVTSIIEIAKTIDSSANLVTNYNHSDFGINTEVILTFNCNLHRIKF